ncbi:hypothetical protein ACEWY4_022908 [Coilia grayii]|uniref:Ig-like domain-containing protein n=1 Tax=Coilia grayii TaxID=363190 RepID=A0ABD1J3H3_9TELE
MGVLCSVWANGPPLLGLLLILCQYTGAQDDSVCDAQILVRRHTVLQTSPMKPLMLSCTIRWSGCDAEPTVTWCKLLSSGNCVNVNASPGGLIRQENVLKEKDQLISHLIFQHVAKHDDGLYRCEISGLEEIVSHAINVSVSDVSVAVKPTERPAAGSERGFHQDWLLYVLVSAVCVLVILTVILLCICALRAGMFTHNYML